MEKNTCLPSDSLDLVQNGFMNSVELNSFLIVGKRCFLRLTRRKWKLRGSDGSASYTNSYDFALEGTKATKLFGSFKKSLVCKCPFDISVICEVLGLPYNKFYRWFKSCLTNFKTEAGQIKLHKHDFNVLSRNGPKTILVPVFRPEHFGSHMAIDEKKHIHGVFYTVLTNAKTGKVALLCSTIRANELKTCLDKFDPTLLDGA